MEDVSILDEILHEQLGLVQAPDYFETLERGQLKLVCVVDSSVPITAPINATQPPETSPAPITAIERGAFTFQSYLQMAQKLRVFQTSNDIQGYRNWLASEDGLNVQLWIALQKLNQKTEVNTKHTHDWQQSYAQLSRHYNIPLPQIQKLHKQSLCFRDMHLLLNRFVRGIRQQTRVAKLLQPVWPDVYAILNQDWHLATMSAKLEYALQKIDEPKAREYIDGLLRVLFTKAEQIATQHT